MYSYSKELPIAFKCDILVVGGSQSGVAAAVSAKRANPNASVHLIEQFGYLGGQSVGVMVCHYEFREYTNNKGQILTEGIGKEMIERIVMRGHSDPLYQEWLEGQGPPFDTPDPRAYGDIPLDLNDMKIVFQEMCDEAGVIVHLFTKLLDVIPDETQENGRIKPKMVIASNYFETIAIKPQVIIDCSANNDVAWKLAKEDGVYLPDHQVMPMQWYVWLGNVDCKQFLDGFWEHRDYWSMVYPNNKEQMYTHMREGKTMIIRGGASYLDIADEKYPDILEELEKYCNPIIYYWIKPVKITPQKVGDQIKYDSIWAIEGPVSFNLQSSADNVSNFQQNALKAAQVMQKIHSVLPGWENCKIVRTSDRMGFRQTRILKGEYEITEADVTQGTKHEDVIGRGGGHDISRHHPEYEYGYDIPLRALIPRKIDNVIVGARSISCDPNDKRLVALNAHRGIQAAIVVSQAAGVTAALSVKEKSILRNVSIALIQEELRNQKVVLKPPE